MKKLLIALMAIATITGCKTIKKSTESTETTEEAKYISHLEKELDSLYNYIREKDSTYTQITQAQDQTVEVDNPCDSLTGLLRDFEIKAGKTTVKSKDGKLSVNTACDETVRRYQSSEKEWKTERSRLITSRDSLNHELKVEKIFNSKEVKQPGWIWLPFWAGILLTIAVLLIIKIWL